MARLKHVESEYGYRRDQENTRRTTPPPKGTIVAPTEGPKTYQGPGDLAPPWSNGGRQADLPADYDQRACANEDYRIQRARSDRQDREALGQPKSLDGTPWIGTGKGHPR
jgi:hypothetical protein